MLNDDDILWWADVAERANSILRRTLVPGILAPVHSNYGHPDVARTTILLRGRCSWPSSGKDARDYMRSCGCTKKKRAHSRQVAMLSARFCYPGMFLR